MDEYLKENQSITAPITNDSILGTKHKAQIISGTILDPTQPVVRLFSVGSAAGFGSNGWYHYT